MTKERTMHERQNIAYQNVMIRADRTPPVSWREGYCAYALSVNL